MESRTDDKEAREAQASKYKASFHTFKDSRIITKDEGSKKNDQFRKPTKSFLDSWVKSDIFELFLDFTLNRKNGLFWRQQ